jgi:hypothetical protein
MATDFSARSRTDLRLVRPAFRLRPDARWPASLTAVLTGGLLLVWPAVWNAYPLVFADTGTYLSQAIEHHLGWDRPPVYSFFMLPLHLTVTTWPVVLVQAALAAHTLHLVRRCLFPGTGHWWLVPMLGGLATLTWLPWLVSQLMPDVFTPLLVLALALLVHAADRLARAERVWLAAFSAFMIATQQSSLLLSLILIPVLLGTRHAMTGAPLRWKLAAAPPLLAMLVLLGVNVAGYGRFSISPFGNVFLLARVLYDGPGLTALRTDCPQAGWRLCAQLDRLPASSDLFLWGGRDGPIMRAGGHRAVSAEADAIIATALHDQPLRQARAFLSNWLEQLLYFDSGDGLQAWPDAVAPHLAAFPVLEQAAYAAARQTTGARLLPDALRIAHAVAALAGVALCLWLLPAAWRLRDPVAGFQIAVLSALLAGAAITGGLSMPHDRYQSRLMCLPPLIGPLAALRCARSRR